MQIIRLGPQHLAEASKSREFNWPCLHSVMYLDTLTESSVRSARTRYVPCRTIMDLFPMAL
jgi:hypothetical protein